MREWLNNPWAIGVGTTVIAGTDDNVLVIELKKAGLSTSFDVDKLRAYQREYGYKFAYLLVIRTGDVDPGFDPPQLIEVAAS